jgi:geranylgeranyl pyrophosphate synthase
MQRYLDTDNGQPATLYAAAHHLIAAGGKRLRSLVTLLCCEAVGGNIRKVLPITVAAELLQTASLIHDDIIDDDDQRRGVETVHRRFGKDMAILAGDLLIAQAIRIIGKQRNPELLEHIGTGGVQMCEGEGADLIMCADRPETFTKEQYFQMIERKTVAFMRDAARIGALLGKAKEDQRDALMRYGEMLGFTFQLVDDILDVKATEETIQHTPASDLRLKRGNYPLIDALEVSSKEERRRCLQAIAKGNLEAGLKLIQRTEAIPRTYELAGTYVEKAKRALQGHGFQTQALLEQIADFVLSRQG